MANYGTNNRLAGTQQNLATTYKSIVSLTSITGAGLCRGQIYEIEMGADGVPNASDCQISYDVSRQTANDGTKTSATPNALDPADPATRMVGNVNYSGEPTITAASSVFNIALNQRSSYKWAALFPGAELRWPATTVNGLVARALSPIYAAPVMMHVFHTDL
jgi:hypothetical protein